MTFRRRRSRFSALQRAENSSIGTQPRSLSTRGRRFQCSSASRKFLNLAAQRVRDVQRRDVSVLFSEPKIPQCGSSGTAEIAYLQRFSALQRAENSSIDFPRYSPRNSTCFSALQRAENSSICVLHQHQRAARKFQCSSASRKFLNSAAAPPPSPQPAFQCSSASRKFLNQISASTMLPSRKSRRNLRFSALQRAENSSIDVPPRTAQRAQSFQCSSASRKFLNERVRRVGERPLRRFSALQRAENSSIYCVCVTGWRLRAVSVLFSEPKIPQSQIPVAKPV